MRLGVLGLVVLAVSVTAQDPADGWLGYAKCVAPSGYHNITRIEATWKNLHNPSKGGCFQSPWFGIETSDNLNLVQPVNPWTGNDWEIYNEYFQWVPTYNENSKSHVTKPGDVLYGRVTFNANNQSYTMYHEDMTDGWSVTTNIGVQKTSAGAYKNYTIVYFVYEKVCASCNQYPPDGFVEFYDLVFEYDGKVVTPTCTTSFESNFCNNRAHVNANGTISMTWTTNGLEQDLAME